MDTFKIRAILSAAKHRSLSRAAEEFAYTPSAFSHITSAFEEELGVTLFRRHSAGVELTEEGKALLPKFQAMLECETEIRSTVSQLCASRDCELRIGTYPSMARTLLSGIFRQFKTEYPHVKLSIHVADRLTGWLEDDRADLIFADHLTFGNREWYPLRNDRYFAVVPEGWLSGRESVTRDEFYQYPYVFTDDSYLKHYFNFDLFPERLYFKSEDDLSVINMVKEGIGVTVLPELVLTGTFPGVSILRLEPEITRTLGFAYQKQRIHALGLTRFLKSLRM